MAALWFETARLEDGWTDNVRIHHAGGRIASVDAGVAPTPGDERHAIGLPGLCNVHSHAFQRGMAGLAERAGPTTDDFWTWREVMYRFLDHMTPQDVEDIAAFAYVEMLESGFTRVGEFHYVHHDIDGQPFADLGELADRIVAAVERTGIGLTLLPVFYAHGDFGGAAPNPGQRRFINDVDRFARLFEASRRAIADLADARIGVAPHSLRAVRPDELAAVVALTPNGPIHIHAAEQTKEVEACVAWSGRRPVEWLLETHAIDRRWCLIHATHLTRSETARLAESEAVAGLCPVTEANLGDGIFPSELYLSTGGAIAVGTDSNILIDAAGELRALEYAQRLSHRRRNILARASGASTGAALFDAAQAGGARALGEPSAPISVGASLDMVSLRADHPVLVGRRGDAWLDGWVFAAGQGAVDCVWRRGERLVEQGRHRRRGPIAERYAACLKRLLAA